MQRKNTILKRGGFALIAAIGFIVVIATIMTLALANTARTSKQTVDLYLYEQAQVYAKSAVELILLEISKNEICSVTQESFILDEIYDVNYSVVYIIDEATKNSHASCGDDNTIVVQTPQNGSARIDIAIAVAQDKATNTEPIRVFRRTIQKL
ncbi:MAG: hypothetical protein WCR69_09370 [Sulfuricurvum sp.]